MVRAASTVFPVPPNAHHHHLSPFLAFATEQPAPPPFLSYPSFAPRISVLPPLLLKIPSSARPRLLDNEPPPEPDLQLHTVSPPSILAHKGRQSLQASSDRILILTTFSSSLPCLPTSAAPPLFRRAHPSSPLLAVDLACPSSSLRPRLLQSTQLMPFARSHTSTSNFSPATCLLRTSLVSELGLSVRSPLRADRCPSLLAFPSLGCSDKHLSTIPPS